MALIDNIAGYWKLDESSGNAADATGGGTTLSNSNVSYSAGKINNGANFNGSNSSLAASSSISSGPFSLGFWFKTSSSSQQVLFNNPDFPGGSSTQGYVLINAGQLTAISGSGGSSLTSPLSTYSDGNWHYCVYTCGAGTGRLYVDGTQVSTASQTQLAFNYYPFLGRNNNGNYLNGSLDEVGVWSRVLSASEVTELYNGGAGLQYPFITTTLPTVVTDPVTDITQTTATGNGEVTDDGGDDITRRGFVISTSSHGDPGNVSPESSGYEHFVDETGTFGEETFDLPLDYEHTVSKSIAQGADDGYILNYPLGWDVEKDGTTITNMVGGSTDEKFGTFRFQSMGIPNGATVTYAELKITASGNTSGDGADAMYVQGIDVDDMPPLVDVVASSTPPYAFTTAFKLATPITNWSTDTQYSFYGFENVVQEIVDRPGWTSSSSIGITAEAVDVGFYLSSNRQIYAYEGDPAKAAQLVIKYLGSLSPSTTYYVRAFAENSAGYSYGDEESFATLSRANLGNFFLAAR